MPACQIHAPISRPRHFSRFPHRFSSTGWRFSRWNGSASIPWQQPGAWADCSRDVNISFIVPANGAYGTVSVTFALDAAKVAGWWANNGAKNYGLLLR